MCDHFLVVYSLVQITHQSWSDMLWEFLIQCPNFMSLEVSFYPILKLDLYWKHKFSAN